MTSPRKSLSKNPIGIFDSGVGGLTVVRAVRAALPNEDIVYLGDTARVPYGSKSAETVTRYSLACTRFLLDHDIKLLLVACNTATAHALPALRSALTTPVIPVIGAVEPGAKSALEVSKTGQIGVIGTLGTIRSGAYEAAIASLGSRLGTVVTGQSCALLVPLAEEGWTDDDIAFQIARRYLRELAERAPDIDTLVLGCTHYPLLAEVIAHATRQVFAHPVRLVDSASAMARAAVAILDERSERRSPEADSDPSRPRGRLRCFVTDASRLGELAPRFLGEPLDSHELVDLSSC
jgi:glutamate racemase